MGSPVDALHAPDPGLKQPVAGALLNKGASLADLGRSEEAIAVCDEVLRRYGDTSEPALKEQVARALVNKGVTLSSLGRGEEALTALCAAWERRDALGADFIDIIQKKLADLGGSTEGCS